MTVNVIQMSTDYTTNVTEVKVEVTENVGRVVRQANVYTVTVAGRHESITDELMELVFDELEANGLDPFPDA